MSAFGVALQYVLAHEIGPGGRAYVNDPKDAGGETYKGVSRRYNPSWEGWAVINGHKGDHSFPRSLDGNALLQGMVNDLYRNRYWGPIWGDGVASLSSGVAYEMMDTAVNMGTGRAVRFLQKALNALNRDQRLYADLVEDGAMGPSTLGALATYLRKDKDVILLKVMNILQGMHYVEYMRRSPEQERYARGWFKRVKL